MAGAGPRYRWRGHGAGLTYNRSRKSIKGPCWRPPKRRQKRAVHWRHAAGKRQVQRIRLEVEPCCGHWSWQRSFLFF